MAEALGMRRIVKTLVAQSIAACILAFSLFFFKIQMRKGKQEESNGSMIIWDEFGCRSDVVQMSFKMSFRSRLVFRN